MAKKSESKVPAASESWTPASHAPFEAMRRGMDEMFGRLVREWPALDTFDLFRPERTAPLAVPSMDVSETDKGYELAVDLPGMDEKDIEVSVDGDMLTIRAEHAEEREEKKKTYHLTERRRGSLRRSVRLPQGVERDKIQASFDKGVLTLALPKGKASPSVKKIRIGSA